MNIPEENAPAELHPLIAPLCKALDEKKAESIKVIDVRGISTITDYLVIATGMSEPHLRALRIAAEMVFDAHKSPISGMDMNQESGWLVVDAFQVMAHFFVAEARQNFALEQLWKDGREIPIDEVLGTQKPAPAKAKKSPAKKKPAAKTKPVAVKAKASKPKPTKAKATKPKTAKPKATKVKKAAAKKPAAKKAVKKTAKKSAK